MRKKFIPINLLVWLILLVVFSGILAWWQQETELAAHTAPGVSRADISVILETSRNGEEAKAVVQVSQSREACEIIAQQTGLSAATVGLLWQQGRQEELLQLQDNYFKEVQFSCVPNSPISREEYVADADGNREKGTFIPYIEEGDILITFCSHVLGWRNGHAGMVVDAKERLVLEAQVLGSPVKILSLEHWEQYPSFVVLRLKGADRQTRRQIAEYAEEELLGQPYRLTAGIGARIVKGDTEYGKTECGEPQAGGTQCAHLVWYACRKFGYELDSDGGLIVTPRDIYESPLLETVQRYGM